MRKILKQNDLPDVGMLLEWKFYAWRDDPVGDQAQNIFSVLFSPQFVNFYRVYILQLYQTKTTSIFIPCRKSSLIKETCNQSSAHCQTKIKEIYFFLEILEISVKKFASSFFRNFGNLSKEICFFLEILEI